MKRDRLKAFTMIELVFVIVILGIISKFGVEFLFQAYNGFIYSKVNNTLQNSSATAVEFVAARLQYRIKDSIIAREDDNSFKGLSGYSAGTANMIEWVGYDIEGFRGDTDPYWSGVIDLATTKSSSTLLKSPGTNTLAIDDLIKVLSNDKSDINDAALYFVGSNNNVDTDYGWDFSSGAFTDQTKAMHPIKSTGNPDEFAPNTGANNFIGASEYYQLAWTAYAVGIDNYDSTDNVGDLTLWYNYRPWQGENYKTDGTKVTIMENVSTFEAMGVGSLITIKVCVKSLLLKDEGKDYSLCKEKTIY